MADMNRSVLLIDGNNLAHFLYTNLAPGQKMTDEMGSRLITHLGHYARTHANRLEVELILDRQPKNVNMERFPLLQIFAAEYPQTGDDLLIERFWYHHIELHPCLVVTNDDQIIQTIRSEKGNTLLVYDFVRRAGWYNPVFRGPDDLPPILPPALEQELEDHPLAASTSIHFRIAEDQHKQARPTQAAQPRAGTAGRSPAAPPAIPIRPPVEASTAEKEQVETKTAAPPARPLEQRNEVGQPVPSESSEPEYALTLDAWPSREGARFLRQSFCARHRDEYRDLLASVDYENIQEEDLRAVAELLLHACAEEPDFCARGSLLDRVRLVLLQARGKPVSLSAVSQKTGLPKQGLSRKIKEKAGRWYKILEEVDRVTGGNDA